MEFILIHFRHNHSMQPLVYNLGFHKLIHIQVLGILVWHISSHILDLRIRLRILVLGPIFIFINLAMSDAMWHFADGNTFWAIFSFTSFIWAFNFAFWFFAFNIANCISWFLTTCMATRWSNSNIYYSHTGSQIAGHFGSSHFQAHYG